MDRGWNYRRNVVPKYGSGWFDFKEYDAYLRKWFPPIRIGDTWGIWKLDKYGLEVVGGHGYGISFDRINSRSGILWWIDHMMTSKGWITPVDIWDFRMAMHDIFGGFPPDDFNPKPYLSKICRRKVTEDTVK